MNSLSLMQQTEQALKTLKSFAFQSNNEHARDRRHRLFEGNENSKYSQSDLDFELGALADKWRFSFLDSFEIEPE